MANNFFTNLGETSPTGFNNVWIFFAFSYSKDLKSQIILTSNLSDVIVNPTITDDGNDRVNYL
jgi:hypothetical protein